MITVSHLTMRLIAGGHIITILDDITFEVPEKQMVAIVGPSGSGKSTLLGLIAGLDKPTAGSIRLDGVEITGMPESQMARYRRQKIGYIFQSFHLIPTLNALENVAVPLELNGDLDAKNRAVELLAKRLPPAKPSKTATAEQVARWIGDLSSKDEPAREASRKRLLANLDFVHALLQDLLRLAGQMLRALAQELPVQVVLGLREHDALARDDLRGRGVAGGTLMLVTHDPDLASCAERIITLRDGRIESDEVRVRAG